MFHLCIPRITFITTIFLRPLRLICLHNFDVLTLLSSVIMDSSSASLAEIIPGSHPELPSFSTDLFYITFDPFLDQWRSQDASGTIVHLSEEELFGNLKVFHRLRLYHCSSVSHTRQYRFSFRMALLHIPSLAIEQEKIRPSQKTTTATPPPPPKNNNQPLPMHVENLHQLYHLSAPSPPTPVGGAHEADRYSNAPELEPTHMTSSSPELPETPCPTPRFLRISASSAQCSHSIPVERHGEDATACFLQDVVGNRLDSVLYGREEGSCHTQPLWRLTDDMTFQATQ
jgi:hypothetical protein